MTYRTIVALTPWAYDEDGCPTYADPEDEDKIEGWNIHLQHRCPEDDHLLDPEGAPDLDVDIADYATAFLLADALAVRNGWELRQY